MNEKTILEDLRRWFKEKWTAQDGSKCGDYKGKGRVKCRPSKRVSGKSPQTWGEMTGGEKKKAVRLKQKAHKKGHQFSSHKSGKTWKGDKYKHRLKKGKNKSMNESFLGFMEFLSEENKPTNPKLWSKCKSAAKRKFDVYPCVPLDSQAITKEGIKFYDELSIGEEILTYNIKNDFLEWQPIEHLHFYENAPLKKLYKRTGFSIRATENHKWVVKRGNKYQNVELVETKDINKHMRIITCAELKNESSEIMGATIIRNKKFCSTQNLIIEDCEPENVWCPTTKNQTWVMIQNGFLTITGNSAYANAWAAKCYKKKRKGKGSGWKENK